MTYDDAGEPLSLTYPDGAVATSSYSQGWLSGASWTQHSVTTPILAAVSYSGAAGAFGAITSATVGQSAGAALYHYAAQLDSDGRLTTDTLSRVSDGATLSDERLSYDLVGNISAVTTILPAGTDHQLFCYDAQNRLTWAGTTTGNPCNNPAATGSFGGASYTQSFSYDTLNRLTSGPLGSYTYSDASHLHAATAVSSGYTASYDAAGDMLCRAPSSSTTCAGTQTGQQLTWDVEGRLSTWQNTTTSPTMTATYLYDGEGNRVVQQVTDSTTGTTTTTAYVGSLETVTSNGTTTTTSDYATAGSVLAESVNGTLSYLATTYQGSMVEALDSTGAVGVIASQLYAPYGRVRYSNGAMPTDYGYTGQRADASTGLDYYGARYYDSQLGQFTSADTVLAGGLNRYGYVGDNPTTATDPSGHALDKHPDEGGMEGASKGQGVGSGLAAFFAWLFGEDEATSGAATGSAVASTDDFSFRIQEYGTTDPTYVTYQGTSGSDGVEIETVTETVETDDGQIISSTTSGVNGCTCTEIADPTPQEGGTRFYQKMAQEYDADPPSGGGGNGGDGGGGGGGPGGNGGGGNNGGGGGNNGGGKPVNSKGIPYPDVVDPRTGASIPFPDGDIQEVPPELRVEWDNPKTKFVHRGAYIKDWHDRGYGTPEGGWSKRYELHHILPRQFGGTNDFWNLVPLTKVDHALFTNWWRYFP